MMLPGAVYETSKDGGDLVPNAASLMQIIFYNYFCYSKAYLQLMVHLALRHNQYISREIGSLHICLIIKQGDDGMRRLTWLVAFVMLFSTILVGCGEKNVDDVVEDLQGIMDDLGSYKGVATMVLQTGQTPQEFNVEVWYKEPHYYRIALTNTARDITQVVLRNDEGVFVLTPHLNKSFRFQSDWPDSQGQVYLYQSLVKSILDDSSRVFQVEDKTYVFDVLANYQNKSLARQRVWLNDDLSPKRVQVLDSNEAVVVEVTFQSFETDIPFDSDAFDTKRNMTGWEMNSLPTMSKENSPNLKKSFGIIQPAYVPEGVTLDSIDQVTVGENNAVVLRYSGQYNYTLQESRPKAQSASLSSGEVVDLGFSLGVMAGIEKRTLTWTHDGVEYHLASGDLPTSEMIQIAQSVQGQIGK
jgi:outer membrane lipoprotein-sorting protein